MTNDERLDIIARKVDEDTAELRTTNPSTVSDPCPYLGSSAIDDLVVDFSTDLSLG